MDQDDTNVLSQTRGTRESQGREGGQQSQMLQRLSKFGFRKPFILNIVMSIYPGEGNGNPLQYSCLENPRDRGAWRATVHEVAKSPTRLATKHAHEVRCGTENQDGSASNKLENLCVPDRYHAARIHTLSGLA